MDLTVAQLRYVVAVAEELHFTRAAERLSITTPALSQQIALVERRLGTTLFRRTSRAVELTAAGAELVPLARRVVAAMDEVLDWGIDRRSAGEILRVGVPIGWALMSRILASAAERLPGVQVRTHRINFGEAAGALRADRIDVALTPLLDMGRAQGLHVVPLWSEPRVLVVGTGHPLARRASVRLEETDGERFVAIGDPSDYAAWVVVPRPSGAVPRIDSGADTFEDVLDRCAAAREEAA